MSTHYKTIILLTLLVLELALAFNSERLAQKEGQNEDNRHHNKRHTKDPNEIRIKRRHVRPRQASEEILDEDILKLFQTPESQNHNQIQKRQVQYYPYPPAYPQYAQSTVVPNGNQINNYYPQFLPFQAGLPFPIFVPIFLCFNPQNNTPTTFPNRFSFPDDPEVIANNAANAANNNNNNNNNNDVPIRRPVYTPVQIDTPTGISLEPVRPSRPNARPPPPLTHSSGTQNSNPSNPPSNQLRPLNRPSNSQTNTQQSINNVDSTLQTQYSNSETNSSPCLIATVTCCRPNVNTNNLARCFRENLCAGPFWGLHPCDTELGIVAMRTTGFNFNK